MKQTIVRSLQIIALLVALALPSFAEESKRGFFEGNLLGGGRIVFFLQGNHALSAYIFDTAGHQASFAGGPLTDKGAFSLTTSAGATLAGNATSSTITAAFAGQNITATRVSSFGKSEELGGRFTATAVSDSGESLEVKIVIDAQQHIFLLAKNDTSVIGGFGNVTLTPAPTAAKAASSRGGGDDDPSPSPSPSASPGDDDHHGGHEFEDEDEQEDHDEDLHAEQFNATFTITLVTGETVTGNLTFSHGLLLGDFTLNGVVFHFRAPQESSENHLANISTRGFVNTGQGQLIGGFIITGGPKLVLIRAIGPSMAALGVNPVLANPKLELFQNGKSLALNDNWQNAANANQITATGLAPKNPNEATLLIRLEPGAYTTVVTGSDGGTGIALVEVYEIEHD